MSSYGTAASYFFIVCKNEEEAVDVEKRINDDSLEDVFHATIYEKRKNEITLELKDCEVYSDFDDRLEEFAKQLKENFGLNISGYMLEEVELVHYRVEFDNEGKLHWADTDWLGEYTLAQISEIQGWAEDHFKTPRKLEYVELLCPHCKETHLISARMTDIEYCNVNIVADKNGRCELEGENADTSGDFECVCEGCFHTIANSLDEIETMLKKKDCRDFCDVLAKKAASSQNLPDDAGYKEIEK